MFEFIKNRDKFNFQFGALETLEEGKRYRVNELRDFDIQSRDGLVIAVGVHRRSKKPYTLKLIHLLPGKPAGIDKMPNDWILTKTDSGYSLEWPEETFTQSNLKTIKLSDKDPPGNYIIKVFINNELSNIIKFTVSA